MKKTDIILSFIIVNYKTFKDTIECVNSIYDQNFSKKTSYRIVVIDNNSKNNSIEEISNFFKDKKINKLRLSNGKLRFGLNLIQNTKNSGFGAANNFVFNLINDGYVFLINPDIVLGKNFICSIDFSSLKEDFIYGFPTYDFEDKNKLLFYGGNRLNYLFGAVVSVKSKKDKIDYINGSGLMSHFSFFKNFKFKEDYFLYWEETDLCVSYAKNKLEVIPESILYDKKSTSIGRGFLSEYYYQRNKLFFFKKHKPFALPYYILISVFSLFLKIFKLKFPKFRPHLLAIKHFIINRTGKLNEIIH